MELSLEAALVRSTLGLRETSLLFPLLVFECFILKEVSIPTLNSWKRGARTERFVGEHAQVLKYTTVSPKKGMACACKYAIKM